MSSINKYAKNFTDSVARYMFQGKKNISAFPKIKILFNKLSIEDKKEKVARVESAVSLTQKEKQYIQRALVKLFGQNVKAEYGLDESLVGGMRIKVEDWIMDETLDRQLLVMAEKLIE